MAVYFAGGFRAARRPGGGIPWRIGSGPPLPRTGRRILVSSRGATRQSVKCPLPGRDGAHFNESGKNVPFGRRDYPVADQVFRSWAGSSTPTESGKVYSFLSAATSQGPSMIFGKSGRALPRARPPFLMKAIFV